MDRIFEFVCLILFILYIHVNLASPGHSADRKN